MGKTVVHLTAAGEEAAGKVSYDMHRNMLAVGIDSWILTSQPGQSSSKVLRMHKYAAGYKLYHHWRILKSRLSGEKPVRLKRNNDYHFNVYSEEEYYSAKAIYRLLPRNVDIFIIHFYDGFLNTATIVRLGELTGAKILWLMMDMAPLTGGCHYAWSCKGYEKSCGSCPALYSKDVNDRSHAQFVVRQKSLAGSNVEIISASEWQRSQAIGSMLYKNAKIHKVLTAIPSETFYPGDRKEAFDYLGIPHYKYTIFWGANFINEKRKGIDQFADVLLSLRAIIPESVQKDILILLAGAGDANPVRETGWSFHHTGQVSTEKLAHLFRAATVFVCTSMEDSGPTMINQAIMSGIPVVSFEMGVALDLVHNDKTGYRVPLGNSKIMAERIGKILRMEAGLYLEMKTKCRDLALEKCNPQDQTMELAKICFVN